MTPVPEWREILRYAWSVRFMVLSVLFSAAGSAMFLINGDVIGHPVAWALGVFVVNLIAGVCAIFARIWPQKALS